MARTGTQEVMDLWTAGKLPPFATEFIQWVNDYLAQHGHMLWTRTDIANYLGVTKQVLNSWMRGVSVPGPDYCRRIAHKLLLSEDIVLAMAGHASMGMLLTEAEQHRAKWNNGHRIYLALCLTREREWLLSKSPEKQLAFDELRRWHPGVNDQDVPEIAARVAYFISIWNVLSKPFRETPLYERPLARVEVA